LSTAFLKILLLAKVILKIALNKIVFPRVTGLTFVETLTSVESITQGSG